MSRLYVTTPIYYATDAPHLGHAYTTIVADAVARYGKMRHGADNVRFLTGTDEHGQKVERIAAERGKTPAAFATEISALYRAAWDSLHIVTDDFIRTTDPDHEAVVVELWQRMVARGDIYLGNYEGPYCVACEQFYMEKELAPGSTCPVHGKPVEMVKEESYFFRLSAYQDRLLQFYSDVQARAGHAFVEPQIRLNEVVSFIKGGLQDFSVSRTNFKWGVPVPDMPGHVIYVWIDALINYYSATRRPSLAGFWDDDVDIVHLMGKEITRFHAVYWPAMLMSAGLRLPSRIVAHGWWTVDGEKMSKNRGNVVDPVKLAEDLGGAIGVDAIRYFVLREAPLGVDGDFSHESLLTRYNAELANDFGNLLNRTLGMVSKYFDKTSPPVAAAGDDAIKTAFHGTRAAVAASMEAYHPSKALEAIWELVRRLNTYIDQQGPWKRTDEERRSILWTVLEGCRVLSHLCEPFIPERSVEMRRQLGRDEPAAWPEWSPGLPFSLRPAAPLFPRIEEDRKRALLEKWRPQASGTDAGVTAKQEVAQAIERSLVTYDEFSRLDLRVARIAAADKVPKKDKLLKLTVEVDGAGGPPRTVVAGIGARYQPDELIGKQVIFVANLKPAKIGGILSEGMILAAGEGEVLALSALERECPVGTRVK